MILFLDVFQNKHELTDIRGCTEIHEAHNLLCKVYNYVISYLYSITYKYSSIISKEVVQNFEHEEVQKIIILFLLPILIIFTPHTRPRDGHFNHFLSYGQGTGGHTVNRKLNCELHACVITGAKLLIIITYSLLRD